MILVELVLAFHNEKPRNQVHILEEMLTLRLATTMTRLAYLSVGSTGRVVDRTLHIFEMQSGTFYWCLDYSHTSLVEELLLLLTIVV